MFSFFVTLVEKSYLTGSCSLRKKHLHITLIYVWKINFIQKEDYSKVDSNAV